MENVFMADMRLRVKDCSTCRRSLPVAQFSRDSRRVGGLRSNCKECARLSKSEWFQRHKSEGRSIMQARRKSLKDFIHEIKAASACVDCGLSYHPSLMDFDHLDPDNKIDSVAQIASKTISKKKVQAEIDKCDLVCTLCHRVRTWNRLYPEDLITSAPI